MAEENDKFETRASRRRQRQRWKIQQDQNEGGTPPADD